MSVEDKMAIQEVIAQYSYTYDSQDADGFVQLFVEDGVLEVFAHNKSASALHLHSRAAIRAWALQRFDARRGVFTSRHHQSGTIFDELTADSARTRTMVLVTHQRSDEPWPRPTLTGAYHDHWKRTAAGWRIARRAAHLDCDLEG